MTAPTEAAISVMPCRPCEAYAASADRAGRPAHEIQPATLSVTWPPPTLARVYPRCRPTIVRTCDRHARWAVWPATLHTALSIETEDLTMPEPPVESALEATLRRKRERDMGGRIARRHGYGSRPGQSIQALIDAYLEAGSFGGAALLLNARKVRTWKGGPWSPVTISSMIRGYPAVTDHRPHVRTAEL
jgi:hypothetical protein